MEDVAVWQAIDPLSFIDEAEGLVGSRDARGNWHRLICGTTRSQQ